MKLLKLTLTLADAHMPIWREIIVPSTISLHKLHRVFQTVMGWQDYHLHEFTIDGVRYGVVDDDFPDGTVSEKYKKLFNVLGGSAELSYLYDFGDGWEHSVIVSLYEGPVIPVKSGWCIGGENACPPEDCGGVGGYEYFLSVLDDPLHEEYDDVSRWMGRFDARYFDLESVNKALFSL